MDIDGRGDGVTGNKTRWNTPFVVSLLLVGLFTAISLIALTLIGGGDLLLGDQQAFLFFNPGQGNATPVDGLFVLFTAWGPWNLGLGIYVPTSLVVLALILSWRLPSFYPTRVAVFVMVLACLVGLLLVNPILNGVSPRERPFMDPTLVSNALDLFSQPEALFGTLGFPSNHATAGFIIAGAVLLTSRNYAVKAVALTYGVLNAYSRIYVGVHFPLDVLVGAVVGLLVTLLCFLPVRKYLWRIQIRSDLKALEV